MIEWSVARRLARLTAGSDETVELGVDLRSLCAELELHVAACTRLELAAPAPPAELVGRGDWAEANLATFERMLAPVADRLEDKLSFAGPLAGVLRSGAGALVATEVGVVMGYMSQRVLGQYELSLLGAEAPPRLLFVAPNLGHAADTLEADAEQLLRWVALHEVTHALQFGGVPWLRPHLAGMVRDLTSSLSLDPGKLFSGLPGLDDLRGLVDRVREGGLATVMLGPERRAQMDGLQAFMAVLEGYAEHVMDAVGADVIDDLPSLRAGLERRRADRTGPLRLFEKLIGMDLKLRQYEQGKQFCDGVVELAGVDGLNRVWEGPNQMPSLAELDDPAGWLARTESAAA